MSRFLKKIADLIYAYGKSSAGMVSFRGAYEPIVPKCLCFDEQHSPSAQEKK